MRHADALRPQGHHHARRWSTSRSAKISAARSRSTSARTDRDSDRSSLNHQHQGESFGAVDPEICHARIRPRRGRPRPGDHPGEHQSPRERADDHRPQFPGQDQRQYRQFRHRFVDRGRGRKDALVDAVGSRHGDGPLDRQEYPRDARMDTCAIRRCRSAPCRSIRLSKK